MNFREIIKVIGTKVLMEMFGHSKGAISQWRKNGIPVTHRRYLKLLRPELFKEKSINLEIELSNQLFGKK